MDRRRFKGPPRGTLRGVKLELFPPAMSNAPFTYKDGHTRKNFAMAFSGGLTCLVQHPDGAMEPKMGWAVLERFGAGLESNEDELGAELDALEEDLLDERLVSLDQPTGPLPAAPDAPLPTAPAPALCLKMEGPKGKTPP